MKITKTVCDRCKKEVPCQSFFVETGRRLDPAGSMDSDGQNVDVCPACLMSAVHSCKPLMLTKHAADHDAGKWFLAWLNGGVT